MTTSAPIRKVYDIPLTRPIKVEPIKRESVPLLPAPNPERWVPVPDFTPMRVPERVGIVRV